MLADKISEIEATLKELENQRRDAENLLQRILREIIFNAGALQALRELDQARFESPA